MKQILKGLTLLVLIVFTVGACGKKMAPSSGDDKNSKKDNLSAFNYVYVEALKQKLMGNPGDALKYLEQAVKLIPESDAAWYQMAQIAMATNNVKTAKTYAVKASSIDPSNLWYLMMLSAIYYQEQNIDSAVIFYEKAVKIYPERENLQLTLGNLYSENKNFEKASEIFDKLDQKFGVNENSTPSAVKNLMAAGKYNEALDKVNMLLINNPEEVLYNGLQAEIFRAKGDSKSAKEVYSRLIERNPNDPQIQVSLSGFLLDEKSYDDLLGLINTVFINDKVSREDKISLMSQIIDKDDLIKDYQSKLILASMLLEAAYKNDPVIVLLQPEILIKAGKIKEAAEKLESLIKIQPENYYVWEKLLLVYLQEQNYDKLLEKGEECASRFNRSFLAKILYANGAIEKGKYSIAEEELRKAEILAGDNNDVQLQVLTMRADMYYKNKQFDKAFAVFDEAVKRNSTDLTVLNNYAYYLAEQNIRLKEAEEMAKQVISKEKSNTTFLDTYAWVLYKRGKLREAAEVMEKIIGSGEKADAEWYEHYGFILKGQNKCSQAIEKWKVSVSIDSSKTNLLKEIENCGK